MDKKEIASILEDISLFLDLKGENPFKVRSYANAARVILTTDKDLELLARENKLTALPRIGEGLSEKLTELIKTGKLQYYEELKNSIPRGLLELLSVPSLGPKKVKILYETLHIQSIGELEYACKENRLIELAGFGQKSQEKILAGIAYIKKSKSLHRIDTAQINARILLEDLNKHPQVNRINLAGSIRRMNETVHDIDMVASSANPEKVMNSFISHPLVEEVLARGNTKSSVRLTSGIQADLRIVSEKELPYALHHLTGSKEHNIAMRSRAQKMNLKMNEYGLFKKDSLIRCNNEEELFSKLQLQYIPPELRENTGEIEAAEIKALPCLIEQTDITGIFHVHSDMSDGTISLETMIREIKKRGYRYAGISDHSKSAYYAHGLKEPDIQRQHSMINMLNNQMRDFVIFKGIESDILPDGSLDYSASILETFDFVIASVHSAFSMSETDMTQRIIKAMKNKHCTMLGHLTGRLLLAREGYRINHRDIIKAAADYGVIIELNANPFRLDIDWRHLKLAKEHGVMISINPDAHDIEDLDYMEYGVGIARKGWLSKENVFNALDITAIQKHLNKKNRNAGLDSS